MTNAQGPQQPKFTIRRIPSGESPKPVPPTPPPPVRVEPEPAAVHQPPRSSAEPKKGPARKTKPSLGDFTGGLFGSASGVLAFLGSALGTGLSDEAVVRQGPEGEWWGEVRVSCDRAASLIWATGGRPFTNLDRGWVALSISGDFPTSSEAAKTINVSRWPVMELGHLLAQSSLLPGSYHGAQALDVLVPGILGRWILRRATALGLGVTIVPVLRRPLGDGSTEDTGALLLKLRARHEKTIHAALVYSLSQLPYTIIGEPFDANNRGVLVDVRHRLPLAPTIIHGMIPEGETWVLGPADTGHWRMRAAGDEVDGTALMEAPDIQVMEMPAQSDGQVMGQIPVQVVARPGIASHVDAVLLDETELGWLTHFLMSRPVGELSFLIPGPDCYLLTAPGGLPGAIPFGIPLAQVGPGGLYLELGTDFYPPLPDSARQARFHLAGDTAVVVVRQAAYRFDTRQMLPAWALWVGEAPQIKEGLSWQGERLLSRISQTLRQQETELILPKKFMQPKQAPVDRQERVRLLEQAQRAELAGDLTGAAQMLERAGYPGPAGRLYERAARR